MNPQVYAVGGAVRDVLLGRTPKDIDYVVVGATKSWMEQNGYIHIDASSFPVFLDAYGQEYALARTERKTAAGYHGFEVQYDPTVTLEDDLKRRDLTINAMAVAVDHWGEFLETRNPSLVIDPHGGLEDLKLRRLRHVSEAFAEDPLRVMRVARFQGRYNFSVVADTLELMLSLVNQGEMEHLTPERVWTELEKGLMEEYPHLFIKTLQDVGALDALMPEYGPWIGVEIPQGLAATALLHLPLKDRFAVLFYGMPTDNIERLLDRMKAPNDIRTYVKKMVQIKLYTCIWGGTEHDTVKLLEQLGVFKKSTDLLDLVKMFMLALPQSAVVGHQFALFLLNTANQTSKVTFASLSSDQRSTLKGKEISEEIHRQRLRAASLVKRPR